MARQQEPSVAPRWRDLMRLGIHPDGFDPNVRKNHHKFQRGDAQLEAFVHELENPKKSTRQIRQEREAAKRYRRRRIANETATG